MSWGFYVLYPRYTVGSYDIALCYCKGQLSQLTERKVEEERRKRRERKGVSTPTPSK